MASPRQKRGLTSDWCFIAREPVEPSKMGKQRTSRASGDGAPVDDARKWTQIDLYLTFLDFRRLQVRIAKAVMGGRKTPVTSTVAGTISASASSPLCQPGRCGLCSPRGNNSRGAPYGCPFEMLEPYDGKLSRTVPRGEGSREAPDLPGTKRDGRVVVRSGDVMGNVSWRARCRRID